MSSMIGNTLKISVFGESHGPAIGVTIDGLPPGESMDYDEIKIQMARRTPGTDPSSTPRTEPDIPEILSGVLNGRTTGAPLCAVIRNTDTRSGDYDALKRLPRPSHADYPAHVRYGGFQDVRGGGHFSGRLTAPLTFAGTICRQILYRRGILIGGHVLKIGQVTDRPLDECNPDKTLLKRLSEEYFAVILENKKREMQSAIAAAKAQGNSLGGVLEVAACGLPAGVGDPMFGGVENRLAAAVFGIPAVKGVSFGAGFGFADMTGRQANDPWRMENGKIITETNRNGGVLGGITTGMPLIMRAAIKPTPSIAGSQDTVDLISGKNAKTEVKGRHDPCILPRALPVLEAVTAFVLTDLLAQFNLL